MLPAQHTAVVFLIFDSTLVERAKHPFAEEEHEVVQSQQCPFPTFTIMSEHTVGQHRLTVTKILLC